MTALGAVVLSRIRDPGRLSRIRDPQGLREGFDLYDHYSWVCIPRNTYTLCCAVLCGGLRFALHACECVGLPVQYLEPVKEGSSFTAAYPSPQDRLGSMHPCCALAHLPVKPHAPNVDKHTQKAGGSRRHSAQHDTHTHPPYQQQPSRCIACNEAAVMACRWLPDAEPVAE